MKPQLWKYVALPLEKFVEMEFFCRGALAADSNKLDWGFSNGARWSPAEPSTFTIFVADEHLSESIRILFGEPSEIKNGSNHKPA